MDVAVRDLKARLSEYLARVERGEVIGVTNRGRRIAQIMPVPGAGYLELGLREGWLTQKVPGPPRAVLKVKPAPGRPSTTAAIRADRDA
jgi:prevent-host-death family protein